MIGDYEFIIAKWKNEVKRVGFLFTLWHEIPDPLKVTWTENFKKAVEDLQIQ